MNNSNTEHVLLTGATGFLGHYLLAAILRRTHARCTVLLRPPLEKGTGRLEILLNDLGISLGAMLKRGRVIPVEGALPSELSANGVEKPDLIIHAAAVTRFQSDAQGEPYHTNVSGTRALLQLADHWDTRRFLFVSTAFVCGAAQGVIAENVLSRPSTFNNAYEESKWEAEHLVNAWSRDGRVAIICRPSILFGDAHQGRATQVGGVYVLARAMEVLARSVADDSEIDRYHLPLRIPGSADATVNLVPVCWTADRIVDLIADNASASGVHHLVNPDPPTHAEIKQWLENTFDLSGGRFTDATWPWPHPTRFEEALFSVGESILDYFRCDLAFDSRIHEARPPTRRLVDEAHFTRSMHYMRTAGWGRSRSPTPLNSVSSASQPPLDIRWYFETFMAQRLPDSQVARIEALTATIRLVITSDVVEEWVCRFENGLLTGIGCGGPLEPFDFGYRVERSSFVDIVTGRCSPQRAFYVGAVDFFGDQLMALKMAPIIDSFVREFPVTSNDRANAHVCH